MTVANNIILIGFMACGKSRIGQIIASSINYKLYDLDDMAEQAEGMSINEIFNTKGEPYFRDLETKIIKSLEGISESVIVTGGGAPINFNNQQLLRKLGHIFFLDVSFMIAERRLKKSTKRPLGKINSPLDLTQLLELFQFRRPIYRALGHSIDVTSEDRDLIASTIVDEFYALKTVSSLPQTL